MNRYKKRVKKKKEIQFAGIRTVKVEGVNISF